MSRTSPYSESAEDLVDRVKEELRARYAQTNGRRHVNTSSVSRGYARTATKLSA